VGGALGTVHPMAGGRSYRDAPPPSLRRLLAVLAAACLVPIAAAAVTDAATGDRVETSDRASGSPTAGDAGPPGMSTRATAPSSPSSATESDGSSESSPPSSAATTTSADAPPSTPPTTRAAATTTTAPPTTQSQVLAAPPPPSPADQVLTLVNEARANANPACAPLRADDRLTVAAQAHSDDMAARDYFSHTSPEGDDFVDRAKAAGYDSPGGENIAAGYPSAAAVMDGWMSSPEHAANITECAFTAIGVGVNSDGWYWTQVFGY
jgi:uncharacterized protein YkwD